MLRKMMHQVADFCGVQVLTFCIMSNHFHVLVKVPDAPKLSDRELMRRYKVLYPKPTKYQQESAKQMEVALNQGGEDANAIRAKLLARMADVSEFMKALKQRFSSGIIAATGATEPCGLNVSSRCWLRVRAMLYRP